MPLSVRLCREAEMALVELLLTEQELFVGSFTELTIDIDPASGLTLDDLEFVVPSGLAGGLVSLSRDAGFTPKRPVLMLLAGHEPGDHAVEALASGTLVGETRYRILDTWDDDTQGPPLWFGGTPDARLAGAAWGGGPSGPQNVATVPALGTRRVAVLFVDTLSQRYPTDAATMQGHRDRWMNELVNGVPVAGQTRSTAAFYREVSYNQFDLTAATFGPVSLSGDFATYFEADNTPKGSFFQAAITAGDGLINYTLFDTVVCVTPTVPAAGMTPARFAWPYASIGHWGPYTTSEGNRNLGVVSMPNEWGVADDREIHETFSHELGHNLGLGDQYTPAVAGRNAGGWELMHADDPFPHFSIAHRMMLGWVPAARIRTFNFAAGGAPVDSTVTLHPIELGAPPAGRASAVEVRIGDGLNYYFEYRNGENPQIGDRALPTDDRVVGTDVASPPFVAPFPRPTVLMLPADGDDSGAVLDNGDFYREIDGSPFPIEFRADVSGRDGSKADLRIRYGTNGRPDPSIRPWPASPSRPWQSPDIEVRNDRNAVDPAWRNVPWSGHTNTVVASVTNGGTVLAPGVRVTFHVKNYTIGGAPEVFLGSAVRDVPAGATVEFTTTWVAPSSGHFCIVARIPLYVVPTAPTVVEMTELNNVAQSNYDRFISATGSPSTREETTVEVGNPYPKATRVWIIGQQTNPLYRTYVDTTWLRLEAGETRSVRVMVEYALDPRSDRLPPDVEPERDRVGQFLRRPNDLGLHTYAENPDDDPRHALELLGGADIQVVTGRATRFDDVRTDGRTVTGRVVTTDDGEPVTGGLVIITFADDPQSPADFRTTTTGLQDGAFAAGSPQDWTLAQAEYLPAPGFGRAVTDWLRAR
jgi:M6 family metalloprotease-like protein